MRLIDADDIPYMMLYKENWVNGTGEEAQGAWKRDIDRMPTIDPIKHGKWILKKELVPLPWDCDPLDWDNYDESTHSEWEEFYYCSNCDYKSGHFKGTSYCPHCGAKMDAKEVWTYFD